MASIYFEGGDFPADKTTKSIGPALEVLLPRPSV